MNAMPSNADNPPNIHPQPELSRRNFLDLVGKTILAVSGLFGFAYLVRYFNFQTDPPPVTQLDLGPASQYPLGSRTVIAEAPAILLHTQTGFIAFSLICPHLGCTLEVKPENYACPCHGSKFNFAGGIINGPANKPMQPLRVEETADGNLVLFTGD
jgi:cytochrome b6-f complex iron-sulfur subunit